MRERRIWGADPTSRTPAFQRGAPPSGGQHLPSPTSPSPSTYSLRVGPGPGVSQTFKSHGQVKINSKMREIWGRCSLFC